ncbi:MAG: hypothetical protein QW512_03885 [Thermofilaceae archaeon]
MERREIPAKGSPCPRCGEPIGWLKVHRVRYGDRVYEYLWAIHYLGYEGGRKKIKRCHLGPLKRYLHVEKTMGVEVYGQGVGVERVKRLLESMRSLARELYKACKEIEGVKECLGAGRLAALLDVDREEEEEE